MLHDLGEFDDVVAAGAICPMPDCAALTLAYRSADDAGYGDAGPWEFICPRCGFEFTAPEGDLIFQSVPKDWLLAKVRVA